MHFTRTNSAGGDLRPHTLREMLHWFLTELSLVVEHDHEDDPVWKILWRGIPLRFRDEWLSPAEDFHGCVPWVGAPNDFWWLFRNRTCLRYVTIFTKLVCLVFRDFVNTALGSFATTQYRIREDMDTCRLNLVSFFINEQNCSPPF